MSKLLLGDRAVEYFLKRIDRASAIKITVDAAGLKVTAPRRCETGTVEHIIQQKASWILEQLDCLSRLAGCRLPHSFEDGDLFLFLGSGYRLKTIFKVERTPKKVKLKHGFIMVPLKPDLDVKSSREAVQNALIHWYREMADRVIAARIPNLARSAGVFPAGFRIKKQERRWGSCSSRGNLNFNYRLVMAPLEVVDYVIIHELCHLIKPDHSPGFWQLVDSLHPDYRSCRDWLKKYGPVLSL